MNHVLKLSINTYYCLKHFLQSPLNMSMGFVTQLLVSIYYSLEEGYGIVTDVLKWQANINISW